MINETEKLLTSYLVMEKGTSWSLGIESLRCISELVNPNSITLETGIGYSTIVFGSRRSKHFVCFPDPDVENNVRRHAASINIDMEKVKFLVGGSQAILPRLCTDFNNSPIRDGLDFSLIDGDHAWPVPIIDFYYISMMTKIGGFIMLDDLQIRSVRDVVRFIEPARHWAIRKWLDDGRAVLVEKVSDGITDWFGIQEYNSAITFL